MARMIRAVGVTARKKINPMMIGLVILCSNNPNFIQARLKGAKSPGQISAMARINAATPND